MFKSGHINEHFISNLNDNSAMFLYAMLLYVWSVVSCKKMAMGKHMHTFSENIVECFFIDQGK